LIFPTIFASINNPQNQMKKKLIIIGGFGKGGPIIDCLNDNHINFGDEPYEILGYLNDVESSSIGDYKVLGKTSDAQKFVDEGCYFCFAIHMIGKNYVHKKLFDSLPIPQDRWATIVSKRAFVSSTATLAPGAVVLAFAYVSLEVYVGSCTMLMSHTMVGHNSKVGSLCFVAGGTTIGSLNTVGSCVSFGHNSTILENKIIGDYAIIGAASMLMTNVGEGEIYIGSPAKFLKKVPHDAA
jgi:acetyltransferase-like isoleucine patch superfamily enzyme